jgi:hypothetical protein
MAETIRKMPVKSKEITLKAEPFVDWHFTARMNPPLGVFFDIASADLERIAKGIARILIAWDFPDEEGKPLPPPNAEVVNDNITSELMNAIASAWLDEMTAVPPA